MTLNRDLLLPPPLNRDDRSRVFTASADRLLRIDRSVLLVMMVDLVAPEVLPYLAQHFGLTGPPWRYLKTDAAKRKAIKEAINWHRLKGTPASVELALSWADVEAKVEDLDGLLMHWAEYELYMDNPPKNLPEIKELANFAAPARAHFRRIHGEYDIRPIILDVGPVLDFGLLDDDSGAWDSETGLKLSFAANLFVGAAPYAGAGPWCWIASQPQYGLPSRYQDKVILDQWRLDSEIVRNYPIAATQGIALANEPPDFDAVSPLHLRRDISKSQLALDAVKPDCPLHTLDRSWGFAEAPDDPAQTPELLVVDERLELTVSAHANAQPVTTITATTED